MAYIEFDATSPHYARTPPHERLGVVVHHSVLSFRDTIARMLDPTSKVSYHVLVDDDGTRCTLVPDDCLAWHAGESTFLGRSRTNEFLLGLAFAGDTYRTPLTDAQIASALEWIAPRWELYRWSLDRLTDHRQISPGRKDDLNPVEWQRFLAAATRRFGSPRTAV
ncbi:N-acetylmuramoyl-L-alanine amidase [Horticoccus luteus]|uniref:N-acetylmuramoyl-L-alanine amidase n=1 Tax=Horticoccus luteus TaxID=2862869 RepID=A0A8F9TUN5_9BACT|nr:N-acetylmuramoyl-L-alanine amidase [Horticoccus luteus]QYM77897.1 N-acetylmuramoyl-L-alanine amidase [Horticoccus luteus]